jgi:hypothetical protein
VRTGGSAAVLGMQTDAAEVARDCFELLTAVGVEGHRGQPSREPCQPGCPILGGDYSAATATGSFWT